MIKAFKEDHICFIHDDGEYVGKFKISTQDAVGIIRGTSVEQVKQDEPDVEIFHCIGIGHQLETDSAYLRLWNTENSLHLDLRCVMDTNVVPGKVLGMKQEMVVFLVIKDVLKELS